jgi:hypothetical protein
VLQVHPEGRPALPTAEWLVQVTLSVTDCWDHKDNSVWRGFLVSADSGVTCVKPDFWDAAPLIQRESI